MPLGKTARTVRPCRHLFTDGHQCGSPALRGEELCFYHHSTRRPLKTEALHGERTRAVLPEPLDLHAVQRGLAELLRLTAAELIDLRVAAALHRQLASASQNLARIERSEARADARAEALHLDRAPVTGYINHPTLGTIAPAPEPAAVQTQTVQNEDFETSQENVAEAGCPTPEQAGCPTFATVSSSLRWDSTEATKPQAATLQAPLPDPIARFTLPPEPEFLQSKARHDAAYKAWADAYNTLAQGIHDRAEARAKLHDALFPLDTLTEKQDREDLEHDGRLSQLVEDLQARQERTAA